VPAGLLVLLSCQLVGELAVRLTGLPLPGPVVGMLVFLVVLAVRRPPPSDPLVAVPQRLLAHLQLLFVPAGAGVVVYLDTLRSSALPVAGGLWLSWLLGIAVTGLLASALLRRSR
jgi:holin-like protein